jgi:penicillin-binding protein 1A
MIPRSKFAKLFVALFGLLASGLIVATLTILSLDGSLPQIIKLEDYKPLLVSEVYARGGEKIGEYSRENRTLIPYAQIPKRLVQAFIAAEDDTFFHHKGVNYLAILRAFLVNLTSGEKRQGASTITQQVARSLLLSSEKTYTRKIKEILLAQKMEQNLSKEDILYLYLNQIYFGEGAYGVVAAADTYFRKTVDKLTLAEMAILAGLPQAPSAYSPTDNPQKAKARQRYVLGRMKQVGHITDKDHEAAINEPITVYLGKQYKQIAPYFIETLRQLLVQQLGEKAVLDEGLRIYTSIDFKAQSAATEAVQSGLRSVDKRQGYRGPIRSIEASEEQEKFLLATRKSLINEKAPVRVIQPDGKVEAERELTIYRKRDAKGKVISNIPDYILPGQIVEGLVIKIDDSLGLTTVRFAEGIGLIDIAEMAWARKPDSSVKAAYAPKVTKPSAVLRVGDVIFVKVVAGTFSSERLQALAKRRSTPTPNLPVFDEFAHLSLEQKPKIEGALISFDQKTSEVIAMVGGFEFVRNKNEFNRTVQAKRQTGSAFKTIVYAAALDKGYNPATLVQDAPLVYQNQDEGQDHNKTWKPHNHGQKFEGDLLFRKALIRSLNIPTVKILENISVPYAIEYAKRLGVFSPLNSDLSLGLGSSSLTLYEMTKVFSHFGRLGRRIRPTIVHKVLSKDGKAVMESMSLDKRFEKEIGEIDLLFKEKRDAWNTNRSQADASNPNDSTAATYDSTSDSSEDNSDSSSNGSAETAGSSARAASEPLPDRSAQAPESTALVKESASKQKRSHYFFSDEDQLISRDTAYVMTTLLSGVINEEGGTAGKARAVGRPLAGKTGSTNGYFDGWFVGYSPDVATGVWVGFDEEKTMGPGEVGGDTALPIWVDFMKSAHQNLPESDFLVPEDIVIANIDAQTGLLASSNSTKTIRQAFVRGTEPKKLSGSAEPEDEADFLKKDLTE